MTISTKSKLILTLLAGYLFSVAIVQADFYARAGVLYNDPESLGIPDSLGSAEASVDGSFGYSGALGYKFSVFRVEGELVHVKNDLDSGSGLSSAEGELSQTNFFANGYTELPFIPIIKPYIGAGLGLATVDVSGLRVTTSDIIESGDNDTAFAYQLMAGVRADPPITGLSLTAGYRYLSLNEISVSARNIVKDAALNIDGDANHIIEVGLMYEF